jgi:hypothetical protein
MRSLHCLGCPDHDRCRAERYCTINGDLITFLPDPEPPTRTLDLSSPADALRLAAHAFAVEMWQRCKDLADTPHFMLVMYQSHRDTEPDIRYILTDLLQPGHRVESGDPRLLLDRFCEPGVWKETRP